MKASLALGGLAVAAVLAGVALAQEQGPPAAAQPESAAPPAPGIPSEAVPPEEAPAPAPVAKVIRVTPPEPEEPETPAEPLKRPRLGSAILQAVDKITAETLRFEARVNEPVRFKGVVINVRACETTASDELTADSMAHLDVTSQPQAAPGRATPPARTAFRGWMFANSPGLHPFEHPSYDLWLIACKAASPAASAGRA